MEVCPPLVLRALMLDGPVDGLVDIGIIYDVILGPHFGDVNVVEEFGESKLGWMLREHPLQGRETFPVEHVIQAGREQADLPPSRVGYQLPHLRLAPLPSR